MILYYCRFATRPVLLQLYQAEVGKRAQPHTGRGERGGLLPVPPTQDLLVKQMGVWHTHRGLVRQSSVSSYSPGAHSALADAPGSRIESVHVLPS